MLLKRSLHYGCVPLNARNARGIISSLLFIKC